MKTVWKMLFVVTLVQLVCSVAFAFDLPNTAIPTTDQGAVTLGTSLWDLIVEKHFALALGPALALLIFFLRKYDLQIPKYGVAIDAFLNKPVVAYLLPTVVSAATFIGATLAAGKPISDALRPLFEMSMSAVYAYVGVRKIGEQQAVSGAVVAPPAPAPAPAPAPEEKKP